MRSEKDYPCVLIISPDSFNPYSGGGITLTNLFRGWPLDRIALLHNDFVPNHSNHCRLSYRLSPEDIQWVWPLNRFKGLLTGDGASDSEESSENATRTKGKGFRVAKALQRLLVGEYAVQVVRPSRRLVDWIRAFRPQVIYCRVATLPFASLTQQMADLSKAPIAVHVMDDWSAGGYRDGFVAPYFRWRLNRELRVIYDRAVVRMGICDTMCSEYQRRYGKPFLPFMNTIDASDWEAGRRKDWSRGKTFRLLYAGSIFPNAQLKALQDICQIVAGCHEKGVPVEFRIHTPARFEELYRDVLGLAPNIRFLPPPQDENIVSLFAGADVLVLPVNFDEESHRLMRFSMPTKLPAYLCSGTPILVYGPKGLAQVEYADTEGWGYVVSERSSARLENAIETLMKEEDLRKRIACRGRDVALRNHDAAVVRPAFHKVLSEAVQKMRVGV